MTTKSIIFVSGSNWEQLVGEGYRTRQGALLSAFVRSGRYCQIYVVVETGFHGECGIHTLYFENFHCEIIEISIPNIFPKSLLHLLGIKQVKFYNRIPDNIMKRLQEDQIEFIWSYNAPLGALLAKKISCPLFFDVIDYRINDPNITAINKYINKKEIGIACCLADVVTCNGEIAYQLLNPLVKNKCRLIRNGVEPERFSKLGIKVRDGVGYVGVLSLWTDFNLIEYLLQQFPSTQFNFHGIVNNVQSQLNRLMTYPNFHWPGPILPLAVPDFIASCQVGIVPYDPTKTTRSGGDSMKVFEYLAAGTPVVSTRFQARLEQKFQGLIHISDDYAGFRNELEACLSKDPESNWQKKAWDFVKKNSWQKRVQQIISLADEISTGSERV